MRASDALRVLARRVLKLSRINAFHLYDLLHAQQFLLVRVFGKGGHLAAFFIINFRSSNLGLFGFPLQAHARKKKES